MCWRAGHTIFSIIRYYTFEVCVSHEIRVASATCTFSFSSQKKKMHMNSRRANCSVLSLTTERVEAKNFNSNSHLQLRQVECSLSIRSTAPTDDVALARREGHSSLSSTSEASVGMSNERACKAAEIAFSREIIGLWRRVGRHECSRILDFFSYLFSSIREFFLTESTL